MNIKKITDDMKLIIPYSLWILLIASGIVLFSYTILEQKFGHEDSIVAYYACTHGYKEGIDNVNIVLFANYTQFKQIDSVERLDKEVCCKLYPNKVCEAKQ